MRQILAACVAALSATAILTGVAAAAPTAVNVRIEGRSETLFEGPVASEPHGVRASSDKIAAGKLRRCDGINVNDPQNTIPGVTPTAISADAMTLIGETFDGRWFKQYEDYFVTRFGPDAENLAGEEQWGVLVNNAFTSVGGCQYQLRDGDEVLWIYDAFAGRPTLALFPAALAYDSGPRPLTLKGVAPEEAVPLEVVAYADDREDNPPAGPTRAGSSAFTAGARVAPVLTDAKGFQRVDALLGTTTDAQGRASVSYAEPGWHRVKATVGTPGAEGVIRSNRLDICVEGSGGAPLEGASTCAELPAADRLRAAPPGGGELEGPQTTPPPLHPEPKPGPGTGVDGGPGRSPGQSARTPAALRLSRPHLDRRRLARGRLTVSWRVLDPGPGIRRWTISSRVLRPRHARWVTRARGTRKTTATIRLPRGAAYRLRFVVTDARGETATAALGKLKVPRQKRHRRHRHRR